jgi:hypothetical protein
MVWAYDLIRSESSEGANGRFRVLVLVGGFCPILDELASDRSSKLTTLHMAKGDAEAYFFSRVDRQILPIWAWNVNQRGEQHGRRDLTNISGRPERLNGYCSCMALLWPCREHFATSLRMDHRYLCLLTSLVAPCTFRKPLRHASLTCSKEPNAHPSTIRFSLVLRVGVRSCISMFC